MTAMNDTEPLGLPRGSVRALLASMVTGTTMFLYATSAQVPDSLLAITGVVLTFYFSSRARENEASPQEEKLPEPFLPDEQAA